jgi:tRNA(Ile2) C34 agmatinyltransferase TiaS
VSRSATIPGRAGEPQRLFEVHVGGVTLEELVLESLAAPDGSPCPVCGGPLRSEGRGAECQECGSALELEPVAGHGAWVA